MKEHGILYKGEMVRAYLAGLKTQTRRLAVDKSGRPSKWTKAKAGDVLWGRETHQFDAPRDGSWPHVSFYGCKGASLDLIPDRFRHPAYCLYAANWLHGRITWRPAIHMPRWASRITQPLLAVRIERLQEISEADAKAEGADCLIWSGVPGGAADLIDWPLKELANPHRNGYALLWESINGPGSWDLNPEVVVLTYPQYAP